MTKKELLKRIEALEKRVDEMSKDIHSFWQYYPPIHYPPPITWTCKDHDNTRIVLDNKTNGDYSVEAENRDTSTTR